MPLKRYVIERDVIGIGAMSQEELSGASATSNDALAQLGPRVQWSHSYVAGDKTFCIYFAEDEAAMRLTIPGSVAFQPQSSPRSRRS